MYFILHQNIMSKCVNIKITQILYIDFFLIKSSKSGVYFRLTVHSVWTGHIARAEWPYVASGLRTEQHRPIKSLFHKRKAYIEL